MASQNVLMKGSKIILSIFVVLCLGGCITYFGIDGPYEGKVIDIDTGQPIEGAVVHGAWVKADPGPGGTTHTYYDSREVQTDKNGEFKIPGHGLLFFSNIESINMTVLKVGYTQISAYIWGFTTDSNVELRNNKALFKLRHMSPDERKIRSINTPIMEPTNKYELLIRESNKENFEMGKPTHPLYPVEK